MAYPSVMDETVLGDAFLLRAANRWCEALQAHETGRALGTDGGPVPDAAVVERIAALGIRAETLAALALSPLIEVAWSDGDIDGPERAAVLAGIEDAGVPAGTESHELLGSWLDARPSAEVYEAGSAYRCALSRELSVETRFRVRERLSRHARRVAEASGGFLGMRAVSTEEEIVLERLDEDFGL